jgi:peptide/nickel transport system ATP-binding protein
MTATLPEPSTIALRPIVELRGLDVGYVRRRKVVPAVTGMDLTVAPGEIVAVVGESGSGKTTTANAVIGLLPANGRITAGSALVDGVQTAGAKERTLRGLRGSVVGFVPQDPMVSLNPTRRVGSQIAEAVRLRGVTGDAVDAEVLEFLTRAGIPEPEQRVRQYPHELSGGLRQRVLIAMALAGRPKLIIADEPTSALDVTVQKRILDHLEGLVREQGISLLIITHDLAVAADRADRVVVMQQGRTVEQGDPRTILSAPAQAYTRKLIAAAPGLAHHGRIVPRFEVAGQQLPEPILTLTDLTKTFAVNDTRRGQRGFNALSGVTLEVPRGQTHALVGESGCGKTTTLRIALGLETATSGSIRFDGTELTGLSWGKLRPLRRKVQLVHQNPFAALDPKFTIKQTIVEPLVSFGIGDRRSRTARARELLEQVALPAAFLERLPTELSGGQRQRVAVARALALQPELLMLDEPVSALDVSVQEQILDLLSALQRELGLSYLFVSHDLSVVAQVSHTVTVLRAGRVVEQGSVQEVFTNPRHEYTRELIDAIPGRRAAS